MTTQQQDTTVDGACATCGYKDETSHLTGLDYCGPYCGGITSLEFKEWEVPCSIGDRLLTTLSRSRTFRRAYIRWNS